jgi:hypothetical protein
MQPTICEIERVLNESQRLAQAIHAGALELSIPSISGDTSLSDLHPDGRAVDYIVATPEDE